MKIYLPEDSPVTHEEIKKELEELKNITKSMSRRTKKEDDKLLTFKQAAEYLGFSHSYLHKLTARKIIPCHRPTGRLYFYKHEVDAWVKGREQRAKGREKEAEGEGSMGQSAEGRGEEEEEEEPP